MFYVVICFLKPRPIKKFKEREGILKTDQNLVSNFLSICKYLYSNQLICDNASPSDFITKRLKSEVEYVKVNEDILGEVRNS